MVPVSLSPGTSERLSLKQKKKKIEGKKEGEKEGGKKTSKNNLKKRGLEVCYLEHSNKLRCN